MKQINLFTNKMVKRLKKEGFTIQYYHARSTNSVYLKLDYGMGHSIRISDHKGKHHLKYRYNMVLYGEKPRKCISKFGPRYFAPFKNIEYMVGIIKKEKLDLINHIGIDKYEEGMKINFLINDGRPGFWANYKLV